MKSGVKILFFLPLFAFFLIPRTESKENTFSFSFKSDKKLQVGEELTYVVSYTFIKLGELKFIVKDKKTVKGKTLYSAVGYIDSYSGIPFVDLHQIYECEMNKNYYSTFFRGLVRYDKYQSFTNYNFDYPDSIIKITKGRVKPYQLWTDSTTSAQFEYQDGLSILYYARMNSGTDKTEVVPGFVNEKKVYTTINFYDKVVPVSISSLDYDVACTRIDGETNFVSVFGLTGYFEGWFSADSAAVPIAAKMHVIIGNIKLELKEWKRPGWTPPKYAEN